MPVVEFLRGRESPGDLLRKKEKEAALFNGLHLVVGDVAELWYFTNTGGSPQRLAPGVHGLSNGPLDDPWPKTRRSVERLRSVLEGPGVPEPSSLLDLLADRSREPDPDLPSTGVPLEWERLLSSVFIEGEGSGYGTRSSTVLLVIDKGQVRFVERTFEAGPPVPPDVDVSFVLDDGGPQRDSERGTSTSRGGGAPARLPGVIFCGGPPRENRRFPPGGKQRGSDP